ncbi:cation channel sperm-associated protein subunit gamma-like, partial [Sceloporus undulatus]|uniref:cation channel sperm-associated protein subunit gamma-like n=1 Tax=Sceloporus undulatus TaxID=8520 RepID=UPI001C4C5EEE
MRGFLLAKLLLILLHTKCALLQADCTWRAAVNRYGKVGAGRDIFMQQHEIKNVEEVFKELVDSAIDPDDRNAKYYGFPYYLKIYMTCRSLKARMAVRTGHYTGLKPVVTVSFEEPVHAVRQKQEQLEIEMMAAPFRMT